MRSPFKAALLTTALTLGLSVAAFAADKVQMSDLPQPAQHTIQQYLEGGQVTNLEKTTKNNNPVYQADVKKPDGSKTTIQVAPDGKLIELKRD